MTSIKKIILGNGVTSIGGYAFSDCSGLTDVYCWAEDIPATDQYSFQGTNISAATLHVPAASLEQYRATAPWNSFGTIVALTDQEIEDAIVDVKTSETTAKIAHYDIQGRKIAKLQKGINIIRHSDGTSRKVIVK